MRRKMLPFSLAHNMSLTVFFNPEASFLHQSKAYQSPYLCDTDCLNAKTHKPLLPQAFPIGSTDASLVLLPATWSIDS